jgi:hypothetical protein
MPINIVGHELIQATPSDGCLFTFSSNNVSAAHLSSYLFPVVAVGIAVACGCIGLKDSDVVAQCSKIVVGHDTATDACPQACIHGGDTVVPSTIVSCLSAQGWLAQQIIVR